MVSLWFSLPKGSAGERPDVKKELSVLLRPQVLSALLTTVLGAGAMFTLYTYDFASAQYADPRFIAVYNRDAVVLIGVGFSLGNYLGGKFADRSVSGTLKGFLLLLMAIMLAIPLLAQSQAGAAISMIVWGAATFAVVPPLQMRVMRVAHEAPGLSSSGEYRRVQPRQRAGRRRRWGGDLWRTGIRFCAGDGRDHLPVWRCCWSGLADERSRKRPLLGRSHKRVGKR